MPILEFSPKPSQRPTLNKGKKLFIATGVAALLALGSTFAANINLTAAGNDRIQFGQGVARTVVCGTSTVNVLLTPTSSFINASRAEGGGAFFFTGLTLSQIPSDCLGTSFRFRAYSQSGENPLQLSSCAIDGTSISVYFSGNDGFTNITDASYSDFNSDSSTATINNANGESFNLDWNGDCSGAPISATNIYRVTIESFEGPAPTVRSDGGVFTFKGHYYQFVSEFRTWNQAYDAIEVRNEDGSCTFIYKGLCGYFANVTSEQEKNFILRYVGVSDAWLGGADHGGRTNDLTSCSGWDEGFWRWTSGPERCQRFSAPNNPENGEIISGTYSNWNGGEPNDSGLEHALQMLDGGTGLWNDLPQSGPLMGYVVEYSRNYTP